MATTQIIARVLIDMQYLANSPVTPGNTHTLVENYSKDLSDIPPELLEAAATHYRTTETFFPQSGALRQKALELMTAAMRIPTAAEAWGYVMSAPRYLSAVDCEEGNRLRKEIDGKIGGEYWTALRNHDIHFDACGICSRGGYTEDFKHPAVAETVRLLGGRDRLLTDQPTSDRARFIEAYNQIVNRETKQAIMHTDVKEFVNETRAMLEDRQSVFDTGEKLFAMQGMKQLSDGMRK